MKARELEDMQAEKLSDELFIGSRIFLALLQIEFGGGIDDVLFQVREEKGNEGKELKAQVNKLSILSAYAAKQICFHANLSEATLSNKLGRFENW